MTVKSSVSLTDEQHRFTAHLVEAGAYGSVSAVVQQGLELLRQRIERDNAEYAALKELLHERVTHRPVTGDEMDSRIARLVAERRRLHGLEA